MAFGASVERAWHKLRDGLLGVAGPDLTLFNDLAVRCDLLNAIALHTLY